MGVFSSKIEKEVEAKVKSPSRTGHRVMDIKGLKGSIDYMQNIIKAILMSSSAPDYRGVNKYLKESMLEIIVNALDMVAIKDKFHNEADWPGKIHDEANWSISPKTNFYWPLSDSFGEKHDFKARTDG